MDFNALSKLLITIALSTLLTACGGGGESDSRVVISGTDVIFPLNDLQYQSPMVVQVADSDGSPQASARVKISLITTSYNKGWYAHVDIDGDGTTDEWRKVVNFNCQAEDINNNVVLDAGEDINGNGLLEPETPSITAHPEEKPTLIPGTSTIITDDNGFGYFTITYPKSEGSWVSVRITATTEDGLSENKDILEFELDVAMSDIQKPEDDYPPFLNSPYGFVESCSSPN